MLAPSSRPLSPHLTIWRWGPHMLVSILHRITGAGLAIVGGAVLLWWLWAAADGRESYEYFVGWATHWTGIVVGVGLTWAFLQHLASGIRHLVMDVGAGFELNTNKRWSTIVAIVPVLLTALFWAYILFGDQL
ncbi:succinate dehydrogenase, cytochrome b556 subunit [Sphingosinicella sp. YJ22]|uniref:succinate dehydrogenase, cytochrome b556 subunit n=1 Tax=Sphingosinicella sp. YJ22 TaxID=1104780 RepID=UPI001408EBE1|nr:succinate dehydrogenase, cytochrome b556 subunit [Sphingosinicella sp. YJ22]